MELKELNFNLLLHTPHFSDLAHSDYWLFAELKKIFQGKDMNEKLKVATEVYFEQKSLQKHRTEK